MRSKFGFWRKNLNSTRVVVLSFALVILTGTLLLMLPVASRSGQSVGMLTALFTATSATCVTGLVLVDTWLSWTLFGQIVILLLIQLGGLGFMTGVTLILLAFHRRISLSQRLMIASNFNLKDVDGVVRVVRQVFQGTMLFEGIGAVILSACLIPHFGLAGIWRGIFHSVSAFCNAGFDLMGIYGPYSSLTEFSGNPAVLLTVMALIIIGGLGFFVWGDIRAAKCWKKLSLYSKMVLIGTAGLILTGTAAVLAVEWSNPATLGSMPVWEKTLNAVFQSVTLRTAGFNTIDQGAMMPVTKLVSILLMLIGGCSGSTAGGVKVGTICVLLLAVRAGMSGKEEVTLRGRSVPPRRIFDAMTLVFVVAVLFLTGTFVLTVADHTPLLDAAFEVASAIGTVGVSTGITSGLSVCSRVLLICLMFLGRVGILSFSVAFLTRKGGSAKIKYPSFDIMIG